MKIIEYSLISQEIPSVIADLLAKGEAVQLKQVEGEPLVLMSLDEYNSLMETVHLMSSPENARRLKESFAQADKGDIFSVNIDEI